MVEPYGEVALVAGAVFMGTEVMGTDREREAEEQVRIILVLILRAMEVWEWSLFIINQLSGMKTLLFCLLLALSSSTLAQSSARFAITRSVIAGGGTTFSTSARFQLGSTIAQPLAAVPSSARFSIQGGFWIWPSPTFSGPTVAGTNFIVSFQTTPGNTYIVQYTTVLWPPNWQSLPSVAGNGAVESVTNSASGGAQKFYRLIEQ